MKQMHVQYLSESQKAIQFFGDAIKTELKERSCEDANGMCVVWSGVGSSGQLL
jgi:hypothetical protein